MLLDAREANQESRTSGSVEARCSEERRAEATGPGWELRAAVTAAGAIPASSRWSGVEAQRLRQREEKAVVRAASLVGRREMMLRRSKSGRQLMRSSSSEAAEEGKDVVGEIGGGGR
jgi:hypothetical protein